MVSGCEVELHVEKLAKGTEETGHKLRSAIAGGMGRYSVLGEDVNNKEKGKVSSRDSVNCRYKDPLL
jgi:hypothetical protein